MFYGNETVTVTKYIYSSTVLLSNFGTPYDYPLTPLPLFDILCYKLLCRLHAALEPA